MGQCVWKQWSLPLTVHVTESERRSACLSADVDSLDPRKAPRMVYCSVVENLLREAQSCMAEIAALDYECSLDNWNLSPCSRMFRDALP